MAESRDTKSKDTNFIDHVVNVRRVTKVTKGGKRFSFSAFVVSGNKDGKVGFASGKSREAISAIAKATKRARENTVIVPLRNTTIPYSVAGKHGASKVIIRPASKGTGNIAGGAVRSILDAVGIEDALTKSIGSSNGINVTKAALNALSKLRSCEALAKQRGMSIKEMVKGSDVKAA